MVLFIVAAQCYSPLQAEAAPSFQTFKEDELIHKDSCLTRQLAYVRVKVIYISLSEYETTMATLP